MNDIAKLHIVVRADLPASGDVAVQAIHAARAYQAEHSALEAAWFASSNTIALLTVPNEAALRRLLMNAMWAKVTVAHFTEPDLGDSLTAIAIEPGARGAKLCRGLPCALPYEGVTIGLDVDDRGCLMKSYNEQRMPCSAAMSMRFAIMVVERLGGADMATLNAMERRFEELMADEANDGRSVVGCNGTVLATI